MSRDIGIDLGTANVLIHVKGRGLVLNQPAVIAYDHYNGQVIAVGKEAYAMLERTPDSIDVVYPLKNGVIADYELAEAMLVAFLKQVYRPNMFSKPRILISTPTQVSEIERQSLIETVQRSGAGQIFIEEETKVAAAGSGIDILSTNGNMVIDIGGGTSDVAVITAGEVVNGKSVKIAGDEFERLITEYVKEHYKLAIGKPTAETVKIKLATAKLKANEQKVFPLRGRDITTGLPKSINITTQDVFNALQPAFLKIARAARQVLEDTSAELVADISRNGIILTGGGALIDDLDNYLSDYLDVNVITADEPLLSVASGSGIILDLIQNGQLSRQYPSKRQQLANWWRRMRRRLLG